MMPSSRFALGVVFVLLSATLLFFQGSPTGQSAELQALDVFQHGHAPHPDIVILAIDQASLTRLGRWPWPRDREAQIMEQLKSADPTLVALDLTLALPSKQDETNDRRLARAIQTFGQPVVLASEAVFYRGATEPQRVIPPLTLFVQSTNVQIGHVNIDVDPDGKARRLSHPFLVQGSSELPFSFAIAYQLNAPLPDRRPRLVNFTGPAGSYPTYSVADLFDNKLPTEALHGKIILIGATASDLHDAVSVPLRQPVMAGVEWQANVLDNLLRQDSLPVVPVTVVIVIGCLIAGFALWGWRYLSAKTMGGSLAAIGLAVLLFSFGAWQAGWALPYLGNVTLLVSLFVLHGFARWYLAEADKRQLRQTVQPYFSPPVLEAILREPARLKLGGERREVTIFFSDIRSFTTLSESLPPERLTHFLQDYFTEMSAEIRATDGVLAQFLGDGIYAFWGAPMEQADHANRAVATALAMLRRLEHLNQRWSRDGYPPIRIGIGINTGFAIVGNTGSHDRFDYAAIGDTTNTAARLEALNKEYATQIIISAATREQLTIPIKTRRLGSVTVRGKTKVTKIYEVIGNENHRFE